MIRRVLSIVIGLFGAAVLYHWWQRGHEPPAPQMMAPATVLAELALDDDNLPLEALLDQSAPESEAAQASEAGDLVASESEAAETQVAVAPAGWVPTLVEFDRDQRNAPVALLQRADAAMEQGALYEPPGESAIDLYFTVLDAAPGNVRAREGMERARRVLLDRLSDAMARGDYPAATTPLSVLEQLRPDDPELAEIHARLEQVRPLRLALERARRALERDRLDEGPRNAVGYLQRVLEEEPQNPTARAYLEQVQDRLLAQAVERAQAGEHDEADAWFARAETLAADRLQRLTEVRGQLDEQRARAASALLSRAHRHLDDGDIDSANALLAQALAIDGEAVGVGLVRDRIRNVRLYGGHAEGEVLRDALASGGEGPAMVVIPVGSFLMGSPDDERGRRNNEGPQFRVRFDRGFALAVSELTVAEFRVFIEASGYRTDAERARRSTIYDERSGSIRERTGVYWRHDHNGRPAADDLPVTHVSWNDAAAYARWLAQETGRAYRLPSEAEFEYVLRAGSRDRYPWGDGAPPQPLANVSTAGDRSPSGRRWSNAFPGESDGHFGIAPVRSYPANRYGVHDLVGNLSEWVEDCWHSSYLRAPSDGRAWVNPGCGNRVVRGGSWASAPDQVRSAYRLSVGAGETSPRVGFRVARDL